MTLPTHARHQQTAIADERYGPQRFALALGDNIFYGHGMTQLLPAAANKTSGASVFAYHVQDPEHYGVVEFDDRGCALASRRRLLVPDRVMRLLGSTFTRAWEFSRQLQPSARGELEITDSNREYLEVGELHVEVMGPDYAWLDTRTHESLLAAATFIEAIETRQALKVACPEEIAFRLEFNTSVQVDQLAAPLKNTQYRGWRKAERCRARAGSGVLACQLASGFEGVASVRHLLATSGAGFSGAGWVKLTMSAAAMSGATSLSCACCANYSIAGFVADSSLRTRFPHCPAVAGRPVSELIAFVTDRHRHDWRYATDADKISGELDSRRASASSQVSKRLSIGILRTNRGGEAASVAWIAPVVAGARPLFPSSDTFRSIAFQ